MKRSIHIFLHIYSEGKITKQEKYHTRNVTKCLSIKSIFLYMCLHFITQTILTKIAICIEKTIGGTFIFILNDKNLSTFFNADFSKAAQRTALSNIGSYQIERFMFF